ncbi:hypothetical protein IU450_12000 [Nocardia abscessus]|uniref:hypothetical protein n=1 Tax=Nocardia abscessus TaxID=120957 RepID=UPI00189540FC|nr:hypothetical protein [Nocardia abscessus]MBF6336606.1 hypothetical protein [Nocardia abscessus]
MRPDVAAGQPNTLPLAPANAMTGQPGFLIMRTYSPSGGPGADSTGFARVDTSGPVSAFPNVDNAYLRYALVPPRDDRVLVVRGKAPRTARGEHPAPWPRSVADVRYFSRCAYPSIPPGPVARNPLPDGTIDDGCRTDDRTAVDADG